MAKKNVAVFGAGSMGKNHVNEWAAIPEVNVAYVIDTNPAVQPIAEKVGAEFVNMNVSNGVSSYDTLVNPEWHMDERRELHKIIGNTDIWSIATPTDSHGVYLGLGLDYDKKIFLEKPTTDSPDYTENVLNNATDWNPGGICNVIRPEEEPIVQVDYIEMAHPVLSAIIDDMNEAGFMPNYSINWRGKDLRGNPRGLGGGQGSRIVLEDLVHDISEVTRIRNENEYLSNTALPVPEIINPEIKTWYEKYEEKFPYSADVESSFELIFWENIDNRPFMRFPIRYNKFQCLVKGGFDQDEERRYFALKDPNSENAYFGQTLARDNKGIEPVAVKVSGAGNVKKLFEHAENGTANRYNEVINDCDGSLIDLTPYLFPDRQKPGMVPLAKMIRNLHEAKTPSDLICPIEDAIQIETIAEKVYQKAGRPDAMKAMILRKM